MSFQISVNLGYGIASSFWFFFMVFYLDEQLGLNPAQVRLDASFCWPFHGSFHGSFIGADLWELLWTFSWMFWGTLGGIYTRFSYGAPGIN